MQKKQMTLEEYKVYVKETLELILEAKRTNKELAAFVRRP